MSKSNEGKRITTLIVLLFMITMLLSCIWMNIGTNKISEAYSKDNIDSNSIKIGEMLRNNYDDGNGDIFNSDVFLDLIKKISGESNPNKNTLKNLDVNTAQDFRELNGGKDIVVTIGGKMWVAKIDGTQKRSIYLLETHSTTLTLRSG